jgi:single-stranded DNA-specific DHH superfamily exonuclease
MFQKEFEKLGKSICERIKNSKSVGICFDSDADGVCSAALLTIYLLKEFKKYPDSLVSCFHDVDEKLKKLKHDLIFILDTQPKKTDSQNFIIIDHHLVQNKLKKAILFNPTLFDKNSYIATSYLVYKILNSLTDMSEACWIASTGIKADKSESSCGDILELTYDTYPEFKQVESRLIRLTSVSKNLPNANIVVNSLIECYNIGSPSFFGKTESSSKLLKIARKVNREAINALTNIEKILETEKVIVYKIKSEFNVQSLIVNRLFIRNPKKIVVVCNFRKNEEIIRAEVRTNQQQAFEEFSKNLKDLIEDIGGHKQAFGFSFTKENFQGLIKKLSKFK